ncbi:uncharacterized protein KY384_006854 [Bacidia gigantensis]|uniref:uncharacterized protein n=1 Tax=Bacidia gigantensis TaxID=2732470 RepID=UPI001D057AA9|nr:uncharacterized protein KY384_006854 [Bacidia gigantensis]KAG8527938.1 hypothetical protein KY384_006854 [Bacidia gigantensis]
MRRAAVQALRTARRGSLRKLLLAKNYSFLNHQSKYPRRPGALLPRNAPLQIVQSSILFRNFSIAAAVSVVASGVWYYQREPGQDQHPAYGPSSLNTTPTSSLSQYHTASASSPILSQPSERTTASIETLSNPYTSIVVDHENFFLTDLAEEVPLTKKTEEDGNYRMEKLSPEQATQKLRKYEQSYTVGRGRGVLRYDIVKVPSNNPIEDDHAEKIVEVPSSLTPTKDGASSSDWMFWGVFDGHSGWTTSAKLRQRLISFVARELNPVYKSAATDPSLTVPTPQSIDEAIKRGFLLLDRDIVHTSVQKALSSKTKLASTELLAPALSGACALLSFYDSSSNLFRTACTGDSRAVLGRKAASGKWTATPLSEDQTGGTPSEILRLRQEHPGEPEVTLNGRILGQLEPSRAFGDASYKWPKKLQEQIKAKFFGRTPASRLKSPPYVTAEPIITTTKIEPENGDFVVLATDGLWEMLTNEEAVGLVGQWLEKQHQQSDGSSSPIAWAKSFTASAADAALPVERPQVLGKDGEGGQRGPIRQEQYDLRESDERFVTEDKNVATHLVRNALGGKDRDLVCSLLSLISPYSRRYRDDLTVEVIFFGEGGEKTGNVVLNPEASNPGAGLKAKL